jgi:ABC-2 type transport system permease protein
VETRFWLRPIFSVAWKEIRIALRYRSWFVASLVWPLVLPLSFVFLGMGLAGTEGQGVANFERVAGTADFASFLIIGNLVWMFINVNLWVGGLSLRMDRMRGTFDTHWSMPASKLSLVLGATLASLMLNFVPMVNAILIYWACDLIPLHGNPLQLIGAVLLVMPFLLGFLVMFAALTVRIREAAMIVQVMRMLFSLFCGLQFPLAVLPESMQAIGRWVPLTHFITMIRGMITEGHGPAMYGESAGYLLLSGGVMTVIGLGLFDLVRRTVRRRGLVAGY